MKMKGPHWVLVGVVVLYLFAPTQFEQGKGAILGITSRIPGLAGNSTLATPVPADPAILAVRPILTGMKIGYFDKDTNTVKYYTVTGSDINHAALVSADHSYWATIMPKGATSAVWRVRVAPDSTPDVTWDSAGNKVLVAQLLDSTCCSSKAFAAS